jgi:atypical dual specificity phosphatase
MPHASTLYQLEELVVERNGARLLGPFSLELRDRAATVILGPAGTGKSTLLRVLAGGPQPPEVTTRGRIRYRGCDLGLRMHPPSNVVHAGPQQRPVLPGGARDAQVGARILRAFDADASTILLDEPTRGLTTAQVAELVRRVRAHVERGAAIIVSHDLAFVREAADDVCFFVAGALNACSHAHAFFETPPSTLAARFVEQGNCWPPPQPPPLPAHFRWLIPGRLAGMGRPGLLDDASVELEAIAHSGVRLLVTLTEEPVPPEALAPFGIQGRHFPIRDMGVPAVTATARLCREIERSLEAGRPVAVHCHAGMGRTGTLLAACLVWMGSDAAAAIAELRRLHGGYIQSAQQERFVHDFAASL